MTMQMTAGYAMYAEKFGEQAAKRNARRIAILDSLISRVGADGIALRETECYFRDDEWKRVFDNEPEITVLGHTTTNSRGRMIVVYATTPFVDAQADTPTATHMA